MDVSEMDVIDKIMSVFSLPVECIYVRVAANS